MFTGRRSYVEIVAGEYRDGHRVSTEVGISVLDCPAGRILASPEKAYDGEWVSTFTPGADTAIAAAIPSIGVTFGYTPRPINEFGASAVFEHYREFLPALKGILAAR